VRLQDSQNHLHRGRLARPVRAEEAEYLPPSQGEGQAVDRARRPERLRERGGLQRVRFCTRRTRRQRKFFQRTFHLRIRTLRGVEPSTKRWIEQAARRRASSPLLFQRCMPPHLQHRSFTTLPRKDTEEISQRR